MRRNAHAEEHRFPGHLVPTVNLRETALPPTSPRFKAQGTVMLLLFDPSNDAMEKIALLRFR